MVKRREPVGAALVAELVAEGPEGEEPLSDDPWDAWEAPAVQAAMFAKPPAVTNTVTDSGPMIRSWARQQGYDVKDTGRIPENILQAYARAHGGTLVTP
jgi:hypothetical protein